MDAFDVLGVTRRLTVAGDELREAFREAGKHAHPDAGGGEDWFAEVQRAYALLASPAARLRHWLELREITLAERGSVPAGVMDLFAAIGTVVQQAEAVTRKRDAARSALGRSLLEGEVQATREQLEKQLAGVEAAIGEQVATFPDIEAGGPVDPGEIFRALKFLEKWRAELRAKFAALV